MVTPLLIARHEDIELALLPALANRHGLITGATGTGKTITLQLAGRTLFGDRRAGVHGRREGRSLGPGRSRQPDAQAAGAPARARRRGLRAGEMSGHLLGCVRRAGTPVRATISDMGPVLLSRLLNLNDTQAGVLQLVFRIADDNGLLLLDLKDLRAMIQYVGENAKSFTTEYGNVSAASIGAIQRGLLNLGEQGGEVFFGEPMLDIADLMQTDDGRGVVNILAGDKLMGSPRLYSTFLLWLLSELFEQLPEVGDLDKPKLVFFFDEAHLLFNEAPAALLEKIEQVVRLIRSKGVGIYFVTQNPLDIPDTVLGQLGNRGSARAARVHAARPESREGRRADLAGESEIRCRDGDHRTRCRRGAGFLPRRQGPAGRRRACLHSAAGVAIGPQTAEERQATITSSAIYGHYENVIDRESALREAQGKRRRRAAER
jgi:DNA helicase HerA-like ATPase